MTGLRAAPRKGAHDVAIRRAEPGDLGALTRLWIAITRHHEPLDPLFQLRPGAEAEVRRLLRAFLRDPDAAGFVCEVAGELVGMITVRVDRAPPILQEVRRAEISDLGVHQDRRRRGIGRALVHAALDWVRSREVERVEVRVASGNAEGQAFWRNEGFADHMDVLHRRL